MANRETFEFGFMSRREKIKLAALKAASLGWTAACLLAIIFWKHTTSAQLSTAAASLAGPYFYLNFCNVQSEVMELFEPPYPLKGNGLGVVSICLEVAAIYYHWIGG